MSATSSRRTDQGDADAVDAAPGHPPGEDRSSSKAHRITFRVFSGLVSLFVLAYFGFGLLEVVVMWLPGDMLSSMFGGEEYPGGLLVHRSHFMAIGLVAWAVVPAVLVQLRKPRRRVAPMLQAVVMSITGAIAYGLAGTLVAWVSEDLIVTIPILVLAALHPRVRDLVRRPAFDRDMIRLAAIAAVPWTLYALAQARLQLANDPGDIHAGIDHWATAFMMAVAFITSSVLGASDHDGWRLSAWTAMLLSTVFATHSLVFPGSASGLPTIAAVGAITWSLVYAVALVRRSRADEKVT